MSLRNAWRWQPGECEFRSGRLRRRRAGLRHRAEPVFSGDVRNVFLQLDYAFAGAAFSREQPWLIERYAVFNRPFALRYWLIVPFRHIEPLERKPRRAFRPFPTRFSFLP